MIRFVLSPDGVVTPDLKRRLPGRGVWIDASRDSLDKALAKRAFARGFRAEVRVPEGMPARVSDLLRAAALQRLALLQKAGGTTLGFEKVKAALQKGAVAGLVQAADAADDGRAKLAALAKKASHRHNVWVLADVFSSAELGSTLGRDRVVHVALSPGRASDLFLTDALRLRGFELGPRTGADDREHLSGHVSAGPLTV